VSDLEIIKLIEQKLTEAYGLSIVLGSHGLQVTLETALEGVELDKEALQ
jgi:hypothetical protein